MSEINSNINEVHDARRFYSDETYDDRIIAKAPVDKYAFEYNMEHKNRGLALIFNHEIFKAPDVEKRLGANVDCENLKNTFENLNFDVRIYKDLKFCEILYYLSEASKMDHTDNDCIVICILSHGNLGRIHAYDIQYKQEIIWNSFTADKCPTLAGKPKLFFIQACRGNMSDNSIILSNDEFYDEISPVCREISSIESNSSNDNESSSLSYRIPVNADFLIVYSTISGYQSWRYDITGSWFIQSLCRELNSNGTKLNILTLLTSVLQRVAIDFEIVSRKQIPCIRSTLIRILKFNNKEM